MAGRRRAELKGGGDAGVVQIDAEEHDTDRKVAGPAAVASSKVDGVTRVVLWRLPSLQKTKIRESEEG